jgi:hypothetical protein
MAQSPPEQMILPRRSGSSRSQKMTGASACAKSRQWAWRRWLPSSSAARRLYSPLHLHTSSRLSAQERVRYLRNCSKCIRSQVVCEDWPAATVITIEVITSFPTVACVFRRCLWIHMDLSVLLIVSVSGPNPSLIIGASCWMHSIYCSTVH